MTPEQALDHLTIRGRLEIQHGRDIMIGLCIGMREPRWYDGIFD